MIDRAAVYMRCFVENPVEGKSYPIEGTKGKQIMGYCQWDMDNNRNTILDFKKVA